ncbi:hypothetical protein [Pseudorhodoplanes sinuspersici]|nr:hypothetical protein [Pseudorhodoplanes sinuspersici]RKE72165.1 hypothetical protein DFP91_0027 [Pseudorhodoplanes sinuspersici]
MANLDERMLISRSRRILIPVKPSEISELSAILDDIRPHIHPSCSLQLLALCPPFLSGADGDLAYAHGFHHAAVLDETRSALIQLVGKTRWNTARFQTAVCEGGLLRIVGAARNNLSDLILLATPGWTASRLARWKIAYLRRLSDCQVLVLGRQQGPADGLPISLGAMKRALTTGAAFAPA